MDKGSKKEKLIVQSICLLLSIGLWFYISNVENSIRTISISDIPVQLTDVEDLKNVGLALSTNQTFMVDLKIEGQSSDIYKINKDQFVLEANLGDYALKKGENRIPIKIIDYPSSINIKNTSALTIKVNLDEYKEKVVDVSSEISVSATSGFFVGTPQIEKSEVIVSGAAAQVEKVEKVVVRGTIENVSTDIEKSYNLIPIDKDGQEVKDVSLSEDSTQITIVVSKGKSVPIKVITKGTVPSGKLVSIKALTSEVEINGPKEVTNTIDEITTTAIDLSEITESKEISVNLLIPDGVTIDHGKNVVTVKIEIEKSTSKEVSVKVNMIGKVEGENYTFSTEEVKIKVYDYEDKLQSINSDTFIAELDLSGLSEGEHELAPKITVNGDSELNYEVLNTIKVTVTKIS